MSKHSKWAKIKRQKAVTDVKRGQVFTKLSRAITVAARDGADPDTNVKLRMAIDRALAENMPKDNVQRAIDRGTKGGTDVHMESFTLEGFGPAGAALVIDVVTDKRTRTVNEVRKLLADAGGSLGETGTTQWMFERQGHIALEHPADPDAAELAAIDAGALDTSLEDDTLHIATPPDKVHAIAHQLQEAGFSPTTTEVVLVSQTSVPLPNTAMETLERLVEQLDEHDDVVAVTTNGVPET